VKNIPVNLGGYALMVSEAPTIKTRTKDGVETPVLDRDGVQLFTVAVFAKPRPVEGEKPGKGEEIKVGLATDPGQGFEVGSYVQLIDAVLNAWQMDTDTGPISGISFKAKGLKPSTREGGTPAPSAAGTVKVGKPLAGSADAPA
jgi:hypothetical protein